MSGKGELVKYTSLTARTAAERKVLKEQISAIIDAASGTITVQAMVEAFSQDIVKDMLEKIRALEKK
ncbi:MAG TPA: hypothetical protein VGG45_11920 [Terracidiphilus sp.]|jgi:hypothetical protein